MIIVYGLLLSASGLALVTAKNDNCTDVGKNKGPIITEHASDIILQEGKSYTLICKSNTPISFWQQQISEERVGNATHTYTNTTNCDEEYSYESRIDISYVDQYAIGYYVCSDDYSISKGINSITEEPKNNEHASYIYVFVNGVAPPPAPTLTTRDNAKEEEFLENETLIFNCTVTKTTILNLVWILPNDLKPDNINIVEETNANKTGGILYNTLIIYNATKEHAGEYYCESSNTCGTSRTKSVLKTFLENPYLTVKCDSGPKGRGSQDFYKLSVSLEAYPEPTYKFLRNNEDLPENPDKYNVKWNKIFSQVELHIFKLDISDTANYTFVATNKNGTKSFTHELRVLAAPVITFGKNDKKCVIGQKISFVCNVTGEPKPTITWNFTSEEGQEYELASSKVVQSPTLVYEQTAYLNLPKCINSGTLMCIANSADRTGHAEESTRLLIYEINDGFGIQMNNVEDTDSGNTLYAVEHENITVKCIASKYDYDNVTWSGNGLETIVKYSESNLSHIAYLVKESISSKDTGNYTCKGWKKNVYITSDYVQITVEGLNAPVIEGDEEVNLEVIPFKSPELNCSASGLPLPQINWNKDGVPLHNETIANVKVYIKKIGRKMINSTLKIDGMLSENEGTYTCEATGNGVTKKAFKLTRTGTDKSLANYMIAIGVIILILIILVVYLMVKVRKEKAKRKELAAAGLLYFKDGVPKSLNPDLAIDEQAELLPYDESFEFPSEKLKIGIQLGKGAFGVVYKAEARGIINAEETTAVAVKTVKKDAEHMYVKALASELKIMVHIGKHINILNLLGACTKKVAKRELLVIVEYCKFGNIHNYMQKHREVFIDQLTGKEKPLGKVNRAYTSSSCGSTGGHSDYFGSTNTQQTDNTSLNTANTVRSERKNIPNNAPMEEVKASEGYVQPEWRSNYQSDYSYDGHNLRPLTSRDLLAWAFQIARGMEYLAQKKVLHGDLAARNVLLAEDNIVKICDFGLARSIQKTNEYRTQSNNPLPVKWLAIECIDRGVFSTQSDVWSFGVVLWEIFSLAKTPYPSIKLKEVLPFLEAGNRLDKPPYADDRLYEVMNKCWHHKPTLRPTFSELQETLGNRLEDEVRNHYVDLNNTYMERNAVASAGQEDYLAMVCAPDYNVLVTPSPLHHYVNENSFFPPTRPVPVDDEGYLQMSPSNQAIFSPRATAPTFDFEPRKFNQNLSEASSCGSELTPMLTLNSLTARSGSESDHEGEGNAPYLNSCPRIDEEVDDVFTPSINDNTKNIKNIQSAVTNPIYITFNGDQEKPKDIINYVNINGSVPNGLVK